MKFVKHILVFLGLIAIGIFLPQLFDSNSYVLGILSFILCSVLLFNLLARKSLKFKAYFTSKYNVFTSKKRFQKDFDLVPDLMFEKLIEVLDNSKFKVVDVDRKNRELLAISTMSMSSCGENLYFKIQELNNHHFIEFYSTTLFQTYAWGKNENNYSKFVEEIENSLVI